MLALLAALVALASVLAPVPVLLRLPAVIFMSPVLKTLPAVLVKAAKVLTTRSAALGAPLVWSCPALLSRLAAVMRRRLAAVVAPCRLTAPVAATCSAPLPTMAPSLPLKVPTFKASVPVPAWLMVPALLSKVAAPRVRSLALAAMVPALLLKVPGNIMAIVPVPVCCSVPPTLETSCAVMLICAALTVAPSVVKVVCAWALKVLLTATLAAFA